MRRLGKGGSGEVWEVRDRATGQPLAVKLLAASADRSEILGLVREASALSGLEGLGLPRVLRYGVLPKTKQTFIVRELISGASLRDLLSEGTTDPVALVRALGDAAVQLAEVHRAGLLHGDLKPGNVVVDDAGAGRLVDLGLSAPFLDSGTAALGLTPDYAAPELLGGKRILTVRSEIYSLGASLAELLVVLPAGSVKDALESVVQRATRHAPDERYPSVDEFARALFSALGTERKSELRGVRLWPVLGIDAFSRQLIDRVLALPAGGQLQLVGPEGSGRSTLLRRLAWTLGASGNEVAWLENADEALLDLELADLGESAFVLVDDADDSPDFLARVLVRAGQRRVVCVSKRGSEGALHVPPLDDASAQRLLRLVLPSLSAAAEKQVLARSEHRPGLLRTLASRLLTHAVVSAEELEALLAHEPGAASEATLEALEAAVARGRFADARRLADALMHENERFEYHAALARIATAMGDFGAADTALARAAALAPGDAGERALVVQLLGARLSLRRGDSESARDAAEAVAKRARGDLASDAEAVVGMASLLLGDQARAQQALARATTLAESARAKAIAKGSHAIVLERSGKDDAAKSAYAEALEWAERAEDAWTTTTTHTNLAGLLRKLGDLAGASRSLEAGIDMGLRAGATLLVELSRINLLSLDLYLGRYARAEELAKALGAAEATLSAVSKAQLLGLRAEHAERRSQFDEAISLYAACIRAYRALGRAADAAEIELAALLVRTRTAPRSSDEHLGAYRTLVSETRPPWFEEHEALAAWVLGVIELEAGHDAEAKAALDRAIEIAERQRQREVEWQARETRARYFEQQGATGLARKDLDAAVMLLEQTATALPRDLREVFWNDPRRRALRLRTQAGHGDTVSVMVSEQSLPRLTRARAESASRHFAASLGADDRLLRVLEITRELARERDLDRVLSRVVEHAIALGQAERGAILLRTGDGELEIHTSKNARGVEGDGRAFSRSVANLAIEQGEPVVTDSAMSDPRFGGAQSVQAHALQSVLCVPIHGAPPANQAIGALYLESKRSAPHSELELATLTAFADQAAIAIDNARLFSEAEARNEELSQKSEELERAKERLAEVLERRTEQLQTARKDLRQVRRGMEAHFGYQGLVGTSPAMKRVYSFIEQVKDTDIPVLILGESGTGKEVVARALHQASTRRAAPFVGINCGAIPANLLESELFGHVRGAFTGADRERAGLLRDAKDGTVLLDEIGEMPLAMQAGILRVLQEKLVRPLGGTAELPVGARIIAATNRDLEEMVRLRTFREDLYYRIHVATLVLPSLRDRREDIPMLVDHLLGRFATRYRRDKKPVARDALRALVEHAWPGNVRQLEHVLLSAWLMGDEDEIRLEDLGLSSSRGSTSRTQPRTRPPKDAATDERESILQALAREHGNRVRAAESLGMPRRTFYRRLKQYGLLD